MTTALGGAGWLRRFGPLALVALVVVLIFATGLGDHLSVHELRGRRILLLALVKAHPVLSLLAYLAVYTAAIGLSLPAALVLTLAGGLLFGPWVGGSAAAIGCTLGSTVIFLICRSAVGDALRGHAGSLIGRIEQGVRGDAFAYITALRLLPVAPLWLANLALGFVDIPLRTFVGATLLGILPLSLVYAGVGSGLNRLFASGQRLDAHAVLSAHILLPLIVLALLALAPVAVKQWRKSRSPAKPASHAG
jgi:uncharacterized membrane protein YdjX (TVP38/TMEM64 family)